MLTSDGSVVGSGTAAGANPNSGGDPVRSLTTALRTALGSLDPCHVLGGVFGIAGAGAAGRPAAVAAAQEAWENAGIQGTPTVVTDIAVAFAAGTDAPEGIVVFAGTGAGAAAIRDGEIVRRADGYGWLVGDEGSAVWLGKEAVRAALAAYDGRGSPTLLAESVPRALLGASVLQDLGLPSAVPWHEAWSPGTRPSGGAQHSAGTQSSADAQPSTGGRPLPGVQPLPGGSALTCTAPFPGPPGIVPQQAGRHPEALCTGGSVATATRAAPMSAWQGDQSGRAPGNPEIAQAIIKEVYGRPAAALGRLGPIVNAAATAGDPVARRITAEAAERLLANVDAVRSAVRAHDAPVVVAGSVLGSGPVCDAVRAGLRERFGVEPRQAGDGAVGAAGMALRHLAA